MGLEAKAIKISQGAGPLCEDRADIIERNCGKILVVADGAGGMSGGTLAADMIIEGARAQIRQRLDLFDKDIWGGYLKQLDISLLNFPDAGQAAAVIVAIGQHRIAGASVGDCGALFIGKGGTVDLTAGQHKRPFLGAGGAMPVSFECTARDGRLLLATDGLFRYASAEKIGAVALQDGLEASAKNLVNLVRLPSGQLQDDVAIILCELHKSAG